MAALTENVITNIVNAAEGDALPSSPIVQVIHTKRIQTNGTTSTDRYRLILSDGSKFVQAMLATQLNQRVTSGELVRYSILRLNNYVCNTLQGKRIVIILDFEHLGVAEKIGNPVASEPKAGDSTGPPATSEQGGHSLPIGNHGISTGNNTMNTNLSSKKIVAPAGPIYPIEGLSPYQNKWTIKARVTSKSDIKHWSNARGDGKLFSVVLMDETGEIKATGFNDQVDQFHSRLEENKVYYISKARVIIAKKQFSNLANDYEISFEAGTEIEPCYDQSAVPQIKYSFVEVASLNDVVKDSMVDVVCVIHEVGEVGQITTKTGKPYSKREITLVDQSLFKVRLTLWGRQAETFDASDRPVIAFKGIKVNDFGGRSLSMLSSSSMTLNPDIPEAHRLRGWYDSKGALENFQTFTSGASSSFSGKPEEYKTLQAIRDEGLGMNEKPDFFIAKCTIVFIRNESFSYPACPTQGCNKKVFQDGNEWRCEKCDQTFAGPEHRYILSFNVSDHTHQIWLNGFNEIGQVILGQPAGELFDLKIQDESAFNAVIRKATCSSWVFRCKAKQESFQDTVRIRYTVLSASPIDYNSESRKLIELISQYGG